MARRPLLALLVAVATAALPFLPAGAHATTRVATEPGDPQIPVRIAELVCAHCRKPIADEYVTARGKAYHERCYFDHVAPRCVVCSRPITGEYLKDPWGNSFHREHKQDTPQCAYCSRILSARTSKGGYVYADGRTVCGICLSTAINDMGKAKKAAATVRKTLASWGLVLPYGEIPLHLGDREWLGVMRSQNQPFVTRSEATAFTSTVTRTVGDKVVGKDVAIFALNGMPQEMFTGTIAHEMMHAWNHLNARVRHEPALEEGSANYVEALVLRKLGTPAAQHALQAMEQSDDPIYGEGFRRVRRLVGDRGFEAFLKDLATMQDFPVGY